MAAHSLETVPEKTVAPAATPERATSDVPKQTKASNSQKPWPCCFWEKASRTQPLGS